MIDYELKYNRLESLVKVYLKVQAEYFKTKDIEKFKKMAALQQQLKKFVEPKKKRTLFDLAQ